MRFKKIIEKNPIFNWISIFSYNTKSLLWYSTRFNFHFSIIFWKSQGKQKSTHEPFQEHNFLFHFLNESSQSCHFLFAFVLSETHNYELHVVLDGGGSSQKISFCYFDWKCQENFKIMWQSKPSLLQLRKFSLIFKEIFEESGLIISLCVSTLYTALNHSTKNFKHIKSTS